ncbi:MAG: AMP-binding protein, partial [bacterium]|nr:AMP-binding protein [bacterium]
MMRLKRTEGFSLFELITVIAIIGIMAERSLAMLIGIFGILKSGGAYLPIDPGYPGKRKQYLLADSSAQSMLTTGEKKVGEKVSGWAGEIYFIQELIDSSSPPTFSPSHRLNPSSLAYVIYTSGTTGKPKGVPVEHRNVVANVFAFYREIEIKPADTIIQLNSFAFDAFVEEVFPILLRGGKIAVPPESLWLDIHFLCNFISRFHVNIVDTTPLLL